MSTHKRSTYPDINALAYAQNVVLNYKANDVALEALHTHWYTLQMSSYTIRSIAHYAAETTFVVTAQVASKLIHLIVPYCEASQ